MQNGRKIGAKIAGFATSFGAKLPPQSRRGQSAKTVMLDTIGPGPELVWRESLEGIATKLPPRLPLRATTLNQEKERRMSRSIATYRILENGKIENKVYVGDVKDIDLYRHLGCGSMVFVELPSGLSYEEALEKAEEIKEEASALLATEAHGTLISSGYAEFIEALRSRPSRPPIGQ